MTKMHNILAASILFIFVSSVVSSANSGGPRCIPVPSNIVINKNTYNTDRSIKNTNKNVNKNTNVVKSDANANSKSNSNANSDSNANANSDLTLNQTDNSTMIHREYIIPGVVPIPTVPGFYSEPTPDSSFRSMRELFELFGEGEVEFRITEGALEKLAKGGDVTSHLQVMQGRDDVGRIYDDSNIKWKWLYVGLNPRPGLVKTAMVDGEAKDADTNSLQVFGQMGLDVLNNGNNFFIFVRENIHRKVEASGWGIGLYTAGGLNSANGQESISPGGGMGYAESETGPEDRPWIQGYAGCLEMHQVHHDK